jgi:hypothetical protein
MKIDDIKLRKTNPRKISPEALHRLSMSIERDPEFMKLRPIVIDKNNEIVAGSQRYKAILRLGMTEIPDGWVVKAKDLTPEQIRRFALIDNSPDGMSGDWDWEMLIPELKSLAEDFDFNVEDIGFEDIDFTPNYSPETGETRVTREDVEKGRNKLESQFADKQENTVTLMCPYCSEEFEMSREHLSLMTEKI